MHSVTNEPISSQNKFLLTEQLTFVVQFSPFPLPPSPFTIPPPSLPPPSLLLTNLKEIQKETKASKKYQRFPAEINLSNAIIYLLNSSRVDVKERVDLYLYSPLCLNGGL